MMSVERMRGGGCGTSRKGDEIAIGSEEVPYKHPKTCTIAVWRSAEEAWDYETRSDYYQVLCSSDILHVPEITSLYPAHSELT
jgi:hypothetical protein